MRFTYELQQLCVWLPRHPCLPTPSTGHEDIEAGGVEEEEVGPGEMVQIKLPGILSTCPQSQPLTVRWEDPQGAHRLASLTCGAVEQETLS